MRDLHAERRSSVAKNCSIRAYSILSWPFRKPLSPTTGSCHGNHNLVTLETYLDVRH